jgi:signal transduction histidine kinase
MTCTTEISQLKWAESFEARKAADAREAKRQQEEIIDIISHEMRNPLSAIFQCADMIQNSLKEYKTKESTETALMDLLVSNTEHAAIILMCANHQKRIVDDVLTLSKLEYMMLSVSPRPIEPLQFVQRAVHMFATDLASHDIKLSIKAEPSLAANHVGKIMFDPSRVAQILINLLTNAIKFTRQEPKREISIQFGASLSNPRNVFSRKMNWAPGNSTSNETTVDGTEWGDGEVLYFTLSVTDTGVGMTNEEIKKLFHRFTQASSK